MQKVHGTRRNDAAATITTTTTIPVATTTNNNGTTNSNTMAATTRRASSMAALAAAAAATTTTTTMQTQSPISFTNTAKLPIEIVKKLIAAVERRPNLWLKSNINGQKRCDITPLWMEVSQDVNLPVDICRVKWGHLRDNFRKVYIRNNLSDATPTTWRFYNDMRFMEKPVAENIIQQSRSTNRKSSYWQNNNGDGITIASKADMILPICELTEGCYERELHQPSFSDISSFFSDSHSPPSKRVKYEMPQQMHKHFNMGMDFGMSGMTGDYSRQDDDDEDELNDDDFDEDAATDENDTEPEPQPQSLTNGVKLENVKSMSAGNSDVFTIEVFDDDDEYDSNRVIGAANSAAGAAPEMKLAQRLKQEPQLPIKQNKNDVTMNNHTANMLPFKNITVEIGTNTESDIESHENDAERLFLLSLLPFMHKIDDRRKLHVRQKLQNVLIEEFG